MICQNRNNRELIGGIVAVDIGTSGCRAAYIDADGNIITKSERNYSTMDLQHGHVEQDADEIFTCFIDVITQVLSYHSNANTKIVMSSVLHSLILVDKKCTPLTKLSIWKDTRSKFQCNKLKELYLSERWGNKTGCFLSPSYPVTRLLWYKENQPVLYLKFYKALSIKSYIIYKLSGKYLEDESVASGSGLFNINNREWDTDILEYLELERSKLPDVVPVDHRVTLTAKDRLLAGAELIAGAADGPLAHLGCAGFDNHVVSLSLGTSSAVRIMNEKEKLSPGTFAWSYILDANNYVSGLASNNGGNVAVYYIEKLFQSGISWSKINEMIDQCCCDSSPLFFPYLYQERWELGDKIDTAEFACEIREYSPYVIIKSVLEGLAFHLVSMFRVIIRNNYVSSVALSGSLISINIIKNIITSLINLPVIISNHTDATLLGAYILTNRSEKRSIPAHIYAKPLKYINDINDLKINMKYQQWFEFTHNKYDVLANIIK